MGGYGVYVVGDLLQDDHNVLRQASLTREGEHLGQCWSNIWTIFDDFGATLVSLWQMFAMLAPPWGYLGGSWGLFGSILGLS